jgi:hypothetical protein
MLGAHWQELDLSRLTRPVGHGEGSIAFVRLPTYLYIHLIPLKPLEYLTVLTTPYRSFYASPNLS